jgi:hypothetical protein
VTPLDPEALQVAFLVINVLQELGLEYHLGGSYASAVHGIPRQTHDVDLVVEMDPGLERRIASALEGGFYVDEQAIARAVRDRSSFNVVHLDTGIKVDLFVKGTSPFDESEFQRRIVVRVGDSPPKEIFLKSAEDTILRKLLWYRMGGEVSDRQWQDVRGIVGVQAGGLDTAYLDEWADRLGIRDLLDLALAGD